MTNDIDELKPEIPTHLDTLAGLIDSVRPEQFPNAMRGVASRFVRDCEVLRSDLNMVDRPTSADLVDFYDRISSLTIQCAQLRSSCVKPQNS